MKKTTPFFTFAIAFICLVFSSFSFASANEHNEHAKNEIPATHGPIDTPDKINDYIKHHLQDAHDFTFFTNGETGTHIGFSLPVIIVDNGLHVFSAANLRHQSVFLQLFPSLLEHHSTHFPCFHYLHHYR